jgi:DNA segregation ATPase FtsK/SpoIIIE-like protein
VCGDYVDRDYVPGGANGLVRDNRQVREERMDEQYDKAVEIAKLNGKVSIAMLQRCLSIGYCQASILMQNMQVEGVIGHVRDNDGCYQYVKKEVTL